MKSHLLFGVGLFLALTVSIIPSAQADAKQQEAIALSWLEALNSQDLEAMARVRAAHFQRSELQEVEEWRPGFVQFHERYGQLLDQEILIENETTLLVSVESEHGPEPFWLVFEFHEGALDQVRQIGMRMGEDQSLALPPLELPDNPSDHAAAIDAYIEAFAADGVFSGAVLLGTLDEIIFEKAYGLASREFRVPNTVDMRFDVGSCTKDYTHVAILQLEAKGFLSVDDLVDKHLPDYPNADVRERVTLQQLIDHRSGLGDYFTEEYFATPMSQLRQVEDYIPIWGSKPLLAEPGTREIYSNYGYTVLGAVIEKVSGQSYPDYVREHIFSPAGMVDSDFFAVDAIVERIAVGYTQMSPHGPLDAPVKNFYHEPAEGGPWGKSYSTARDLQRYYRALRDGRLIPEDANWLRQELRGTGAMGIAGGGPGMSAVVFLEEGRLTIVLANMDQPIAEDLGQVLVRSRR